MICILKNGFTKVLKKSKGDPPFDISSEYLDSNHNLSDFKEFNDLINLIEKEKYEKN